MKILIVANGSISDYSYYQYIVNDSDFIICADGGARHLLKMNVVPNIIIGDFDSISIEDKDTYESKKVEYIKFPKRKNSTDTALATELAISKNPSEITYIGTIGTRMDHTLANINLLTELLKKGVQGKIIDEHNEIYLIDDSIEIQGEIGDILSIVPISDMVSGINLDGLEYPLYNASIPLGSSLGVSNKFLREKVSVSINDGLLLVIKARD